MAEPARAEGPVYVLADDGLFYVNPAVSGPGWALTFDGPNGPCMEMRFPRRRAPRHPDAVAFAALHALGVCCNVTLDRHEIDAQTAWRYWRYRVAITQPLPARLMRQGSGRWQPGRDGVILAFGRTWG